MHKFMRTIGFGGCDSDLEMDKIMRKLAKTASKTAVLERNDHPTLYDLRAELAPGMGIAMIGQMTEKGTFKREYAFPYVLAVIFHLLLNAPSSAMRSGKHMPVF